MTKRKPPAVPAQLGKYTISEVLGKGAMGVVYKGFDPHIRRTVALKTIRKDLVDDEQEATLLARFHNEAQAAGRLSHPGIVGVYEWGEEGDVAFLAMEYVEGNSLREYFVRGTRFDTRDTVSVMVQVLDALQHAHEQGVWHRDIKPANIIVMKNGKLKIADFGIARIDSSNLTQIGAIMGTPGYMSPEQYSGASVDWRADLFSAGVVMYQLLTGERPFTGSAESIAYKVCHEKPRLPSEVDPARCTEQFDAVLMAALAKKPEDRFQEARAFRDAVLEAHAAPANPTLSEETVLNVPVRSTAQLEPSMPSQPSRPSQPPQASQPSQPSQPSQSSQPPGSTPGSPSPAARTVPPPGWEAAALKQIEQQLARYVGPVARVLVRRGATQTTDVGQLYRMLAENLANPDERTAFLAGQASSVAQAAAGAAGTTAGARAPATGLTTQLTPEAIEQATKRLAAYLGPIAKVVAKKAVSQASSRRQFCLLLAESLANPNERAQFLHDVGVE
jgi:eukaryotic-like serine/threonine-protein kinase